MKTEDKNIFNMENIQLILYTVFGVLAIFSAIMMITRRNPIASALWLIFNFFMISGLYFLLRAQFIAIIQILVYAGAIMVLFIFVIMLLKLTDEKKLSEIMTYQKITAILFSILLMALLVFTVYVNFADKYTEISTEAETISKAENLGRELFLKYAFPIEAIGLLLLATIVGAVVLAKKKFE
ncbi:MAG: NADH-quinone oxidoreductase subunit J [Ignavibacteria bacterium]|nr:NADH-quinone oxidoreductase subunit J [Ignavibacteria bacterium]